MAKFNLLNSIYNFYTNDLSPKEFEKLIKREAPEVYEFYRSGMKAPDPSKSLLSRRLLFLKDLFAAFLMKLTPLRRIFYSAALFFFVYAYFAASWEYAILSFVMINVLLAFELADKLTAKDELDVARKIQTALMPVNPPSSKHFDIACYTEAAREVGGDYFDFIPSKLNSEKTYIVIGDISGKGMAAALYMVQVQAILHHLIGTYDDLKKILAELNANLHRILRSDYFFTANLACLNGNGEINLCRAGHMPVIHFESTTGNCVNIIPKGMGMGLRDRGLFEQILEERKILFNRQDVLVFYTDGITESMNIVREQFGEERLKNIITANAHKSSNEIRSAVIEAVNRFAGSMQAHDDMTIIVLKAL